MSPAAQSLPTYAKAAHENKSANGSWEWNPTKWTQVPTIGVSVNGNFDGSGGLVTAVPTLTPTGTNTALPIGTISPEGGWNIDFGSQNNRQIQNATDFSQENESGKYVNGIGLSFEIAFPFRIFNTPIYGYGFDFGVIEDKDGFSMYSTTKYSLETGFTMGASVEYFGATPRPTYGEIFDMYSLEGSGIEVGGAFILGFSGGGNGNGINTTSTYDLYSGSAGAGLPIGYASWITETSVYGRRKRR